MLRSDDHGAISWKLIATLTIVVLFVTSGIFVFVSFGDEDDTLSGVQWGDEIKIEWAARVGGRLFDTNIRPLADAAVDGSEPAVVGFDRPKAVDLAPLILAVGSNQFSFGSSEPRINIDSELLGLEVNESHTFTISAENAELPADPAKIAERSLVETFPQTVRWTMGEYENASGVVLPVVGATFTYQGWPSRVIEGDLGDGTVLVKHEVLPGAITDLLLPFQSLVSSVDSSADGGVGLITVRHQLTGEDGGNVSGEDAQGSYLITAVGSNTYTVDYNDPYRGVDLEFTVVVLEAPED